MFRAAKFAEPLHRENYCEPVTAGWAKLRLQFLVNVLKDLSLMLT